MEVAPVFSIITVTFNAADALPRTIRSLQQQSLRGLSEWVVKDGGSRDGTVALAQAAMPDVLSSSPDVGIYDAMNQAVAAASGKWLYFLNAGDEFADQHVLADVAACIQAHPDADVVYGDVIYFGNQGDRRRRFHWVTRRRLLFGDLCHQAVFVRCSLFRRIGPFDSTLRWNADFDWFLRAFRTGARLHYMERDIARFDDSGAHVQAGPRSEAERNLVRARYLPSPVWKLGNLALRVELKLRRLAGQTI